MMSYTMRVAIAAGVTWLAPSLSAQLMKGDEAPTFAFEKVWNDGPASFQDLRGKLVILELSQTW